jgi:hypothetical protein
MLKSNPYLRWDYYGEHPVFTFEDGELSGYIQRTHAPFKRKSRVVIYHRASGPNDPLRVEQVRACHQYCDRNGFRVEAVVQDITPELFDINEVLKKYGKEEVLRRIGEELARPEWDKAKAAIKEGRADILVVYSPDQVFRPHERRTLAYQLCYLPPVAFVEPWQDTEGEEKEQQSSGDEGA